MSVVFHVKVLQENYESNKDLPAKQQSHLESLKKKLLNRTWTVDIIAVFDKRIKNGNIIDEVNKQIKILHYYT